MNKVALLLLFGSAIYGQSTLSRQSITVLPKSDGSGTGEIRWPEIVGSRYGRLIPPSSMYANRTWTLPDYDSELIGKVNDIYGGTPFYLYARFARGTEASPQPPQIYDVLFQYMGVQHNGTTWENAAAIVMQNYAGLPTRPAYFRFQNRDELGTFKDSLVIAPNGTLLPAANYPTVEQPDIGAATSDQTRYGGVYARTAEFWRPGAFDASWVRSQNFEMMDYAGFSTLKWRWKAEVHTITKNAWLEDDAGSPYIKFHRTLGGSPYQYTVLDAHFIPLTNLTRTLGTATAQWSHLYAGNVIAPGNSTFGNLTVTGTCTGCGGGSGGYPLGEVKITDHGAVSNCSSPTTIRTALTNAIAALPVDASGLRSGIIAFPAGCFGWDVANGPILIDRTLGHGAIWLEGAGAGNEFQAVGAGTEIRAIGSAPGAATAMMEFRKALGGGIRNIQLNATGMSNTRILKIRESRFGKIENLQGRRWTNGPGLEMTSESGAFAGSCHWTITGLNLGDVRDSDNASGMLLDGNVNQYSSCSNLFSHGIVMFSKSGTGKYGLKLRYADNNTFERYNIWASDCTNFPCEDNATFSRSSSNYALLLEQYPGFRDFPKENIISGTLISGSGFLVGGKSGSAGNIVNHTTDDCGGVQVAGCFPAIRNVRGQSQYGGYSGRYLKAHSTTYESSLMLDQAAGGLATGGRLDFARQERIKAFIDYEANSGLRIGTATGACELLATVGKHSDFANSNSLVSITVSGGVASATLAASTLCVTGDRVRVSGSTTSSMNGEFTTTLISGTTVQWSTGAPSATYSEDGLTLEIVPTHRWTITGNIVPSADGVGQIGTSTVKPGIIYSRRYDSVTSGTATHLWYADSGSLNFSLAAYGGSGSTERPGLFFDRYRGTASFPIAVESGDRLGVIAFRGMVTGGLTNGALIESWASGRSGNQLSSDLRFTTHNLGSSVTALQLLAAGGASFASTIDASGTINSNGSPAYRAGGVTVIDASRNATVNNLTILGTCSGCSGGAANMVTTDTIQTITGQKTFTATTYGSIFEANSNVRVRISGFDRYSINPSTVVGYNDAAALRYVHNLLDGSVAYYYAGGASALIESGVGFYYRDASSVTRGQYGATLNMYSAGGSPIFAVNATGTVTSASTIQATGFIASGNTGRTGSYQYVKNGVGTICIFNFVGGLLVSNTGLGCDP